MSNSRSRIPSPARSMPLTPRRRETPRKTRSVCSPARSNASGRLSCIIREYRAQAIGSLVLSPLTRNSVLTDNTYIDEPGRKSWWRDLGEHSRDVMEVLKDNAVEPQNNIFDNIEIQSQEEKRYTLDLPDTSDSESIHSIVLPQRKLFYEKENKPQKKFNEFGTRETLEKLHKTNATSDKTINIPTKELFPTELRSRPIFPAALLDMSVNTTASEKTITAVVQTKGRVHNLFNNQQNETKNQQMKRKNMFAKFIESDSDEDLPEIQPKFFALQKKQDLRRPSSITRGLDTSMTSSMDIELDDWQLLPSSTMVDHQLNTTLTAGQQRPIRSRLSKLSEAETGTNSSKTSTTKSKNKSTQDKSPQQNTDQILTRNSSKISKITDAELNKSLNKSRSSSNTSQSSLVTRNKKLDDSNKSQSASFNKLKDATVNISRNSNKRMNTSKMSSKPTTDKENTVSKNVSKSSVAQNQNINTDDKGLENEVDKPADDEDDELNFTLEYEDDNADQVDEANVTENIIKSNKEENTSKTILQKDIVSKEETRNVTVVQNLQKSENKVVEESAEISENNKSHIALPNEVECIMNHENEILNQNENVEEETHISQKSLHKNKETEDNDRNNESQEKSLTIEQKDDQDENKAEQSENDQVESEDEQNESEDGQIESEDEENESQDEHNESKEIQNKSQEMQNENHDDQNEEIQKKLNESQEIQNESQDDLNKSHKKHSESQEKQDKSQEKQNESQEIQDESQETQHESQEKQDESQEIQDESQEIQYESQEIQNNSQKIQNDDKENGSDSDNNEIHEEIENEQNVSQEEIEQNESEVDDQEMEIEEANESTEQNESEIDQEMKSDEENESIEVDNDQENEENDSEQVDNQDNDSDKENYMDCDPNESIEAEAETDQNDNQESDQVDEQIENTGTPNVSHDTTGRNRKKNLTMEAILRHSRTEVDVTITHGRNTSIRKTKSAIQHSKFRLEPRESMELSDGTKNSSAEGSGWDSHRTTRKTLRQTFGKDFTPRKSLRALVMEKSAKRQASTVNDASVYRPQANSTEFPEPELSTNGDEMYDDPPVQHEVSIRTRQATIVDYLEKVKKDREKENARVEEAVRRRLEQRKTTIEQGKVPARTMWVPHPAKPKPKAKKPLQPLVPLGNLPEEFMDDLKYKPPKRFAPRNAAWLTKRLYKYLETKLEPKYDYKARIRAEKFAQMLYEFVQSLRRRGAPDVATPHAVDLLKREMARLNFVKTHYDFYNFFHEFMPREVRIKVIPDIVNKIPHPRQGVFSDIL